MKFTFEESYFKEEIIDGFLVSEAMKRYWGASLKCVEVFSEICERHGLKWWADLGTLLGAKRHRGFIPWDDDLDVGMLRGDYRKFLKAAETELPQGFLVDTYDLPRHKYSGFSVLTNHLGTLFSDEILNGFCRCPFPAGFDIYVYDYVPAEEEERQLWRLKGISYLLPMELIRKEGVESPRTMDALRNAGYAGYYSEEDRYPLLRELGEKVDETAASYLNEPTEYIDRYTIQIQSNTIPWLKSFWVERTMEMPFETGVLPVPCGMDGVLDGHYGSEYIVPAIIRVGHGYPLYQRDLISMISFLEEGGIRLKDLPPELAWLRREADLRELPYQK